MENAILNYPAFMIVICCIAPMFSIMGIAIYSSRQTIEKDKLAQEEEARRHQELVGALKNGG